MKTAEVEVTETTSTKKVIEISLPCFRKKSSHYFKVYEKDKVMQIFDWDEKPRMEVNSFINVAFVEGSEDIIEEEFNQMFQKVSNQLLQILNKE